MQGDFTSPSFSRKQNPGVSFLMPTFSGNQESDQALLSGMTNPGEGMGWLASQWDGLGKYWNNPDSSFGKQNLFGGMDPKTGKMIPSTLGSIGSALGGVAQLYSGLEMADLNKKAFNTQRNLANINIENQVKLANADLGKQYLGEAYARGLTGDVADQFAADRVAQAGLQSRTV